ncbi:MobA/MobL family protein [Microvirga arsenatis]|uniref:MobA/MobL family protein n=1 Tax=Microvirga arsenatis TaxID=2692265 RepID=A0ABW9Z3P3_9HYPH|nr:MobA/MobL family protein [Microvirga arsenatis]NBJ13700.1 MobA/MobL family protein [Microvirga arsenatis]NBJ27150.1 MobA/MobL family protein [Microvirga arsenatis]
MHFAFTEFRAEPGRPLCLIPAIQPHDQALWQWLESHDRISIIRKIPFYPRLPFMDHLQLSGPVIVTTLSALSRVVSRAEARNPNHNFAKLRVKAAGTYALGGLGIANQVQARAAPIRGASISTQASMTSPFALSQALHPAVAFGYDNPSVRFGDRTRGSARPKAADGAQSFHFSHSYVSKTSPIMALIRELKGGRKHSNSGATDHLLYIERDGAAEKVKTPARDPQVRLSEMEAEAASRSSQDQQDYLERLGAVERIPVKNLSDAELDALEYASFGTIGDTLEERRAFWEKVNDVESDPRGDSITLAAAHDRELWTRLYDAQDEAPKRMRDLLKGMDRNKPQDLKLTALPTKDTLAVYKWATGIAPEMEIDIEPGRGGRVQNRIIAELPHELSGKERVRIVRDFTQVLADQGLPYWAVIHAPDKNNDRRNFHVHIVYYDRPAAKMVDPKDPNGGLKWDFEIVEKKRFANRHTREVRPFLQPKLREASEKSWVPQLRKKWEQVNNAVLEQAGVDKRYDGRTYKAMGIDVDPLKHIPSKTFNKERKGEWTEEGVALARRQWKQVEDAIVADTMKRTAKRQRELSERVERAKAALLAKNPFKDVALKEIERLGVLANTLTHRVGIAELSQDIGRLVIDRTASRARLVFHAAVEEASKPKLGRPRKDAAAKPVGATLRIGDEAIEARDFLEVLHKNGEIIDRNNGLRLLDAQRALKTVLERIESLEKSPTQNPLYPRSAGTFVSLSLDPDPVKVEQRKKEKENAIMESVQRYTDRVIEEMKALDFETLRAGVLAYAKLDREEREQRIREEAAKAAQQETQKSSTREPDKSEARKQSEPAAEKPKFAEPRRYRSDPLPEPAWKKNRSQSSGVGASRVASTKAPSSKAPSPAAGPAVRTSEPLKAGPVDQARFPVKAQTSTPAAKPPAAERPRQETQPAARVQPAADPNRARIDQPQRPVAPGAAQIAKPSPDKQPAQDTAPQKAARESSKSVAPTKAGDKAVPPQIRLDPKNIRRSQAEISGIVVKGQIDKPVANAPASPKEERGRVIIGAKPTGPVEKPQIVLKPQQTPLFVSKKDKEKQKPLLFESKRAKGETLELFPQVPVRGKKRKKSKDRGRDDR